jgi:hypothetical protein
VQRGIGGVCGQSALQRSTRSVELVGQSVGTRRRGVSAGASLICAIASLLQSAVHVSVCCLQHILLVCVCLQQSLLLGSSALGSLVSGALCSLLRSTLGGSLGSGESSSEISRMLLLQLGESSAVVVSLLGVSGMQSILLISMCLQQRLALLSGALGGSLSSSASGGLVGSTLGRLLSRTLGSIGSRESSSEIGGVLLLQLRKRSAMVIHLLGVGGV